MALRFEKTLLRQARDSEGRPQPSGREHASRLGDVVDTNQLVTRYELRKVGIDPAKIELIPTGFRTTTMAAGIHSEDVRKSMLFYSPDVLDNIDAEDFYVLLAHETSHLFQPAEELSISAKALAADKRHKDDRWELDAQIWESRQATKFEWDDDRYKLFVDRIYGTVIRATFGHEFDITDVEKIERLGLSDREFLQLIREEAEERPTSFATMRRRPVRVRRHVRRRR